MGESHLNPLLLLSPFLIVASFVLCGSLLRAFTRTTHWGIETTLRNLSSLVRVRWNRQDRRARTLLILASTGYWLWFAISLGSYISRLVSY